MKRLWGIVLGLLLVLPMAAQTEELCMSGTLLFREDFGGNDPDDPVAGTDPAPGMTSNYMQIYDTATCMLQRPCTGMSSGRYLLTKIGYRNASSYTYSHWFIMDDHTYPNDYTRGYLLEIDGRTDNATLFETVIDGLCEGSKLTFSAYVVNVTTSYSYDHGNNGDPQLSFVLVDPETGAELTTPYKTGPVPVDRSFQGMSGEWRNSAHWNLVGMNFTVPAGKTAIKLIIKNACTAGGGNDFAIDDIEIRLCSPPVTIEGNHEICSNSSAILTANFTNDGTFAEPLEYKWWHSEDSLTWTELSETTEILSISAMQEANSGWYKVAVSGTGTIESVNCRAMSEPFRLTVQECEPPEPEHELCMDGILLFREDFGGNDPKDPRISKTPLSSMTYQQLTNDRFGVMHGGAYLITKQGYCNGDTSVNNPNWRGSQWHLQDDHTYPNDPTRGYLLEIDGRGDNAAFYSTTIDGLCEGSKLTFSAYVANVLTWGQYVGRPGMYAYPRLKFVLTDPIANEELAVYDTGEIPFDSAFIGDNKCWQQSSEWRLVGMNFTVPAGKDRVKLTIYNNAMGTTGNDFAIDDIEVHLCMPSPTIVSDNEACLDSAYAFAVDFTNDGTLAEPLEYKWWKSSDSITWTEKPDFIGRNPILQTIQETDTGWYKVAVSRAGNIENVNCRTVSEPFRLKTIHCQGPLAYETRDTTVCDTLMPFTWNELLFSEPGTQTTKKQNQWGFDSLQINWTLHTQICYPAFLYINCDTTVCHEDSISFRGRNYAAPGVYVDTVFNPTGTDTICQLTITDSRSFKDFSITITVGNPPPHPWEHITVSGTYHDTLLNAFGCDSIVTCQIFFKERCIEHIEEQQTFCAGDSYEWHGRTLSEAGDYRDTLWHSEDEACDTAVFLHLYALPVLTRDTDIFICKGDTYSIGDERLAEPGVYPVIFRAANGCDSIVSLHIAYLPSFTDTTFATILFGDSYIWEDETWSEPTEQTRRYVASNGCDSLRVLQLRVDSTLTVEQMDLEYGCADDGWLTLHLQLSRPVDSVCVVFSDEARFAGLRDTAVYLHGKESDIFIPHSGVQAGTFACEVTLRHDGKTLYTASFSFTLLYPASVLEQAWNDVVAVLTHDYNGGYDFVAFQWYENGVKLTGETRSYLYKPLIMGGEYSVLLTATDGTQAMTCPLIATYQTDISLYPTIVGTRQIIHCYVSEEAEMWVYDALGRIIGHYWLPVGETAIPAPGVTGVYIASVTTRANKKDHLYKLVVR